MKKIRKKKKELYLKIFKRHNYTLSIGTSGEVPWYNLVICRQVFKLLLCSGSSFVSYEYNFPKAVVYLCVPLQGESYCLI